MGIFDTIRFHPTFINGVIDRLGTQRIPDLVAAYNLRWGTSYVPSVMKVPDHWQTKSLDESLLLYLRGEDGSLTNDEGQKKHHPDLVEAYTSVVLASWDHPGGTDRPAGRYVISALVHVSMRPDDQVPLRVSTLEESMLQAWVDGGDGSMRSWNEDSVSRLQHDEERRMAQASWSAADLRHPARDRIMQLLRGRVDARTLHRVLRLVDEPEMGAKFPHRRPRRHR